MADTMQHTPDLPVFTLANSDQHDTTPLPGAHERVRPEEAQHLRRAGVALRVFWGAWEGVERGLGRRQGLSMCFTY